MKNTKTQFLLFFFCFLFLMVGNAQDGVIQLNNPSFESAPRPGQSPRGWYDCGDINFPMETPPDVHPTNDFPGRSNNFGVVQKASHGNTYLGMVVRQNESWESVAQELKKPLSPNSCYFFSMNLCKSKVYKSGIRGSREMVEFTTPIKLRIWGGNGFCDTHELLAESELVENTEWEKYSFTFSPKEELNFIVLEAYFQIPTLKVPNGNIMLDDGSPILLISCDAAEAKKQLAKFELEKNDFKEKNEEETQLENSSKESIQEYQDKAMASKIQKAAKEIKFQSNRLTPQGMLSTAWIANSIINNPNHKLIIDFGGLRERNFNKRKESMEVILRNELLPEATYEIINSREERKDVKWIVEQDHLYIGVVKNN